MKCQFMLLKKLSLEGKLESVSLYQGIKNTTNPNTGRTLLDDIIHDRPIVRCACVAMIVYGIV